MTYETTDWEAEAQRIARAFGIIGECEFRLQGRRRRTWRLYVVGTESRQLDIGAGMLLFVVYKPTDLFFSVSDKTLGNSKMLANRIGWNMESLGALALGSASEFSTVMAKGLFHLGLLSPEVETALKISVSAHEKLEWSREYEERYGI